MRRTQIQLTKKQWQEIRQLAFDHEISISEAIRRIINDDCWKKRRDKIFGPVNVESLEIKTRVGMGRPRGGSTDKVKIPKKTPGQNYGIYEERNLKEVAKKRN